jgi:hypothetical protein
MLHVMAGRCYHIAPKKDEIYTHRTELTAIKYEFTKRTGLEWHFSNHYKVSS